MKRETREDLEALLNKEQLYSIKLEAQNRLMREALNYILVHRGTMIGECFIGTEGTAILITETLKQVDELESKNGNI